MDPSASTRRGRPRKGEREARRQHVLDAALHVLTAEGYERCTMLAIAKHAGASKETLYSWFGNREGLFRAVIERNADRSAERVSDALKQPSDPRKTLIGYSIGLLTLLTGPAAVPLNRAAMANPDLAALLLASGRHRIGPIVEDYLDQLHKAGHLYAPDPADAFRLLYGLVVSDTQIRVLLGEIPPSTYDIVNQSEVAIDRFLSLAAHP